MSDSMEKALQAMLIIWCIVMVFAIGVWMCSVVYKEVVKPAPKHCIYASYTGKEYCR